MSSENEKSEFTTIRIWAEDKERLDSMKVHDQQGIHEVIRALILSSELNEKAVIPMNNGKATLVIPKSDPDFDKKIRRVKEAMK